MKPPSLPPSIAAALAEVANIADHLAATACDRPGSDLADMDIAGVLNNLDAVASALCFQDLDKAPAMLNAAARAFRQTFPADSLGWEDAGRLQTIAFKIDKAHIAARAIKEVESQIAAASREAGIQYAYAREYAEIDFTLHSERAAAEARALTERCKTLALRRLELIAAL